MNIFIKSIILSLVALFSFNCSPKKHIVLPVDGRFANICYVGYQNESNITELPNWPEDSVQNRVLLNVFSDLSKSLKTEIKKYSKKGRYKFVEDKRIADIFIGLTFLQHHFKDDAITITLDIKVFDKRKDKTIHRGYVCYGKYAYKKEDENDNFHYHYYGSIFENMKKNFPVWQIAKLFYPHVENSY